METVSTQPAEPEEFTEDDFRLRIYCPNPGHVERAGGFVVDVHRAFFYEE